MRETKFILDTKTEFLKHLKTKFPLYHMSNIFFRDLHYGVMSYLDHHGMRQKYLGAEQVARDVSAAFEKSGILKKINHQSWLLIYPEFALPRLPKTA